MEIKNMIDHFETNSWGAIVVYKNGDAKYVRIADFWIGDWNEEKVKEVLKDIA